MDMIKRILIIYGTRPEAIKLAPVISALKLASTVDPVVAVTGQHRTMLDQVNSLFGIVPDFDLNILTDRQSLVGLTTRALQGVSEVVTDVKPHAVMVQGDTTTCFAGALAAFYQKVPVVHLEAGLRTTEKYDPFPEEANRRLTSHLASLHLAPTSMSRLNLIREGINEQSISITGNTVIDALISVVAKDLPVRDPGLSRMMATIDDRRLLLVTSHRRESWGKPMARTAVAVKTIANSFPDLQILLPAHLNPTVREVLLPPLKNLANVTITEPLSYSDFSQALSRSAVVLTDSGGVQEEAPSLGKPVLVMRDTTERPEAVGAGTVRLVGTDANMIINEVTRLLTDEYAYKSMAQAVNPYGDGHAAARVVAAVEHFFGRGKRLPDFDPKPDLRQTILTA
jgi:UDP-N-acetylglucosamine 2-epimerase (non-hydrolysing)